MDSNGDDSVKPDDANPESVVRKRHTKKGNVIKTFLVDYSSNANLHGLKYIGEKERTIVEKIFWLIMVICSLVLCATLIRKLWIKWDDTPVIVSFAETTTPVWQIPYPALSFCVETKSSQTKFNFTHYYHQYNNSYSSLSEKMRHKIEDISLVCDDDLIPARGRNFSSGKEIVDNLRAVSPDMTHFFFGLTWKEKTTQNVSELFNRILTEEGQCFTFNTLGAHDLFRTENIHTDYPYLDNFHNSSGWSLDDGYIENSPSETYPRKGLGYGLKAGLSTLLRTKLHDIDYLCKGAVQGFKLVLHNPAEFPRPSNQYFRLPLDQEMIVAVKPKMMTTSEGLRPYSPSRRKCYFQNERHLHYFKVYTQNNCEIECLTNYTAVRCGCVHFGVPYAPGMKVCNAGKMACLKQAQVELVTVESYGENDPALRADPTLAYARKVAGKCHCLPACTSLEYEAETSQADYNFTALATAYKVKLEDEEDIGNKHARLKIFFKEPQFITSRRSELYGQTDFLANCGGVLGLFLGFSLLSVVEITYFMTLRVCCSWWTRRGTKKESTSEKEKDIFKEKDIPIPELSSKS